MTLATGVPTVWYGLARRRWKKIPARWKPSQPLRIMCGGSAVPESLLRGLDRFGIRLDTPLGHDRNRADRHARRNQVDHARLCREDEKYQQRAKQGYAGAFDRTARDASEGEAPWDGATFRRTRSSRAMGRVRLFRSARGAGSLDARRLVSHRRRGHHRCAMATSRSSTAART